MSQSAPSKRPQSTTRTLIRAARTVQSASAVAFASFVVVHLATPVSAAVATQDAVGRASDVMLLGREYYQGGLKEFVVVIVSAGAHVVSGVVLRVLKGVERAKLRDRLENMADAVEEEELDMIALADKPPVTVRSSSVRVGQPTHGRQNIIETLRALVRAIPKPTTHQLTGYALIPVVLHHSYIHRFVPSSLDLTPFFNYSFVHHSVRTASASKVVQTLHGLSYGLLASLATYHAIVGIRILSSGRTSPKSLSKRRSSRRKAADPSSLDADVDVTGGIGSWHVGYAAVLGSVGLGVARIMLAANQNMPNWLGVKYDDVLRKGWKLLC
ncbi:hypothetical protein OIV83_001354 [Microbotryomycetes sp. JL201]|nr:hypothetical protein OIV83_001354 [Microbotryomycetes sp. JL201]